MQQHHNQASAKNLHRVQAAHQQQHQQQQNQQASSQIYTTSWGLASKGQLGYAYHSIKSINAS